MIMDCCNKCLTGVLVTPRSKQQYEQARQEWNRAIQKFPMAIIYCFTVKDVSNAVCWARQNNVGIRIRSGGHNYEGFSTGNHILVIDVSPMKQISIDEANNTLYIQSGVRNSELYNYVGERGYPFPGGTCPTVGVAGYVMGGGWGYSSRYLGLGCDSLLELEMVNYQGDIIKANAQHNPDLFWASKGGGGGNFGVVTKMTFRLPAKVDRVTLIEFRYYYPSEDTMTAFLDNWQKWLIGLDNRMTINASLFNSAEEGMGIFGRGLYFGPFEEVEGLLELLFPEGFRFVHLRELTFLEAMQIIEESYPEYEKFQSTGRFVNRQYSQTEIQNIVGLISQRAEGSVYTAITVYALGGKVAAVGKRDTAFYYRDAAYIMGIQTVWENNWYKRGNRYWLYEKFQYLKSITNGSYINFPYRFLTNYAREYYGENARMLQQINFWYDPMNVFRFPQAISVIPFPFC